MKRSPCVLLLGVLPDAFDGVVHLELGEVTSVGSPMFSSTDRVLTSVKARPTARDIKYEGTEATFSQAILRVRGYSDPSSKPWSRVLSFVVVVMGDLRAWRRSRSSFACVFFERPFPPVKGRTRVLLLVRASERGWGRWFVWFASRVLHTSVVRREEWRLSAVVEPFELFVPLCILSDNGPYHASISMKPTAKDSVLNHARRGGRGRGSSAGHGLVWNGGWKRPGTSRGCASMTRGASSPPFAPVRPNVNNEVDPSEATHVAMERQGDPLLVCGCLCGGAKEPPLPTWRYMHDRDVGLGRDTSHG